MPGLLAGMAGDPMMDPRPVAILVYCPRCRVQGEGSAAPADFPRLIAGELAIPCPLCRTFTKVVRKPERPE